MRAAFASGRLWALAAIYFSVVLAIYGVSFWLPQILQGLGTASSATVALISAIPYVAAAVAMVLIGAHSDRTRERRRHVALSALAGAAGFALAALVPASLTLSLAALSLAAMGVWGTLGPFWALPTAFLTGRGAAGGVALVNSVANIGGFIGPTLMGYMRDLTGTFAAGLWLLTVALATGAVIALLLPAGQGDSR
jgi:ACS family tartrate transporter-like MFS transporter